MEGCKYCNEYADDHKLLPDDYSIMESEIMECHGDYSIGTECPADEGGMYFCEIHINYCPMCGRNLEV